MIKQSKSDDLRGLPLAKLAAHCKPFFKILKRKLYTIMVAIALGMSNVMLNETRMVKDSKAKTEQQQTFPDADD